jgi:hypothetical protein
VAQWTWNLRLELGHKLLPELVRTTEFAPALPEQNELTPTPPVSPASSAPASRYAPPATATSWKAGRFTGADFPFPPDLSRGAASGYNDAHGGVGRRRAIDFVVRLVLPSA